MSRGASTLSRILLVDDVPANLVALRAVLEPLGVELVDAASGKEALALLERNDYSAIVMDVRMPGLDGFETAKLVRQLVGSKQTPILFMTASDVTAQDVMNAYSHGHAELLPKPFVPQAMRDKVKTFLELEKLQKSELQSSRAAVSEAEQRLRIALKAANALAWVWDPATEVLECTGSSELFGVESATAADMMRLIHPEDLHLIRPAFRACAEGVSDYDAEYRIIKPDGEVRWVHSKGACVDVAAGGMQVFGVTFDVTDRKTSEAQMQILNVNLARARDQAVRASEAKSTFLANVGHDLKTPLNGIINFAEMISEIAEERKMADVAEDALKIRKLGRNLDAVIDEIMALSQTTTPAPTE